MSNKSSYVLSKVLFTMDRNIWYFVFLVPSLACALGACGTTLTFVGSVLMIYFVSILTTRILQGKLPPGPLPLPIIGNLHQLGSNLHQILWHMSERYGPLMYLWMGGAPMVVASSAEVAMEFLKAHGADWAGRPPSITNEVFSNNYKTIAVTTYGPYVQHLRKICTMHLFTAKRLESFRPSRTAEFNSMMSSIYADSMNGAPISLYAKLSHLATNNLTLMLFNKRIFGEGVVFELQAERFKNVVEEVFRLVSGTMLNVVGDGVLWVKWFIHAFGYMAEMKKVKGELDGIIQELLDLKKGESNDGSRPEDFVDVMLAQKTETGESRLSDETIRGVIQDMLVAGIDTTVITTEWAISELLRHPSCMKRLQAEVDECANDRVVTEKDIANLPYLKAVVKEVLRLYPAVPLLVPHSSQAPTTVMGYNFPADTKLFVNCYTIHRDPKVWENPLEFNPDRFLDHPYVEVKGCNPELIPFGMGRRQCPGMSLGTLFVSIAIARLVQAFDFELPNGQDPSTLDMSENFSLTLLRANPLVVHAKPRLESHLYRAS